MTEKRLEGAEQFSIQDQIWKEIHRDWEQHYPGTPEGDYDIIGNFLNNFFVKLFAATNTEEALRRGQSSKENLSKSPLQMHSERHDVYRTKDPRAELLDWGRSEKYIEKTGAEHLADIVAAIKASSVNEDELKAYVENYQTHSTKEETQRLLLPVYIKLRQMGYTHEDLRISS